MRNQRGRHPVAHQNPGRRAVHNARLGVTRACASVRTGALAAVALVASTACHHSPRQWTVIPPVGAANPPKVFDVVWQSLDPNGLPLNPAWGSQRWTSQPGLPPAHQAACAQDPRKCTGQKVVEDWAPTPSVCRIGVATGAAGPIPAHFDWSIAAFTGLVRPSDPAISDDEDFNFIFQPGDPDPTAGLTETNVEVPFDPSKKYIELEFFSHEVANRFGLKWWRDFADDAERVLSSGGEDEDAQARLDERWEPAGRSLRALVIGLFGVDCEHGCRSELHPVYALAVETDPRPAHNVWQIFARNWGNGGSCSTLDHQFNAQRLAVIIPGPSAGATPARVLSAAFARSDASIVQPEFSRPAQAQGLLVMLGLAPPAIRGLEELEIAIEWQGGSQAAAVAPSEHPSSGVLRSDRSAEPAKASAQARRKESAVTSTPPVAGSRAPAAPAKKLTESAYILHVVASLPENQRSATEQRIREALARPPRAAERDQAVPDIDLTIRAVSAVAAPAVSQPPVTREKLQDIATDRSRRVWSILCEATQGQLPPFNGTDVSRICRDNWKRVK